MLPLSIEIQSQRKNFLLWSICGPSSATPVLWAHCKKKVGQKSYLTWKRKKKLTSGSIRLKEQIVRVVYTVKFRY